MWRPFVRPRVLELALAAAAALLAAAIVAPPVGAQEKPADKPAAAAPAPAAAPVQAAAPGPADKVGRLPHVEFSVDRRQVRVECEALAVNAPLEFFICSAGTAEHEAVMRTKAKPSHIHTALLAIGLKPGQPMSFMEATKKWLPPQGPPLHMSVEFERDGKTVSYPAYRWLRDIRTKKEARAFTWIFAGSRPTQEGRYGADDTGYVATLVNFDYALIDIPNLASNSNDLLEWERNAELMPEKGAKVTLVIEPAGKPGGGPGGAAPGGAGAPSGGGGGGDGGANTTDKPDAGPAAGGNSTAAGNAAANAPAGGGAPGLSAIEADERKIKSMVEYHAKVMGPRQQALREAAEAHYKVVAELRKEQQRLISEADAIQRAIDELEKQWADATTPRPEFESPRAEPGPGATPPPVPPADR